MSEPMRIADLPADTQAAENTIPTSDVSSGNGSPYSASSADVDPDVIAEGVAIVTENAADLHPGLLPYPTDVPRYEGDDAASSYRQFADGIRKLMFRVSQEASRARQERPLQGLAFTAGLAFAAGLAIRMWRSR
jgi:hypothetical protein